MTDRPDFPFLILKPVTVSSGKTVRALSPRVFCYQCGAVPAGPTQPCPAHLSPRAEPRLSPCFQFGVVLACQFLVAGGAVAARDLGPHAARKPVRLARSPARAAMPCGRALALPAVPVMPCHAVPRSASSPDVSGRGGAEYRSSAAVLRLSVDRGRPERTWATKIVVDPTDPRHPTHRRIQQQPRPAPPRPGSDGLLYC